MIRFLIRLLFRRWAYLLPFGAGFFAGVLLVVIAAPLLGGAGPLALPVMLAWPLLFGVAATKVVTPFLRRMFHE